MSDDVAIEAFGDSALLVQIAHRAGVGPDDELTAAVHAQAIAAGVEAIRGATPALRRAVPALASVLVPFDPLAIELDDAVAVVERVVASVAANVARSGGTDTDAAHARPAVEVRVRYGGDDGPDLDVVAERAGLRPKDVIELHAGALYRVLFLGFAPGFAYLGGLPAALATARRASPRERVPAGSVAIAGRQSAVYPRSMPGGWQLIGRTDVQLFEPRRADPALLEPGATVRFVPEVG